MILALTAIGWLNSLTQLGLLIFGCILGFFFIVKSYKTQAKLLLYLGLGAIGIGLWQLAGSIDFISILLTHNNFTIYSEISNPFFSTFWFFTTLFEFMVGVAFLYYVAINLVVPEKKYYFLSLFLIIYTMVDIFKFIQSFNKK